MCYCLLVLVLLAYDTLVWRSRWDLLSRIALKWHYTVSSTEHIIIISLLSSIVVVNRFLFPKYLSDSDLRLSSGSQNYKFKNIKVYTEHTWRSMLPNKIIKVIKYYYIDTCICHKCVHKSNSGVLYIFPPSTSLFPIRQETSVPFIWPICRSILQSSILYFCIIVLSMSLIHTTLYHGWRPL